MLTQNQDSDYITDVDNGRQFTVAIPDHNQNFMVSIGKHDEYEIKTLITLGDATCLRDYLTDQVAKQLAVRDAQENLATVAENTEHSMVVPDGRVARCDQCGWWSVDVRKGICRSCRPRTP